MSVSLPMTSGEQTVYAALELSKNSWLLAIQLPDRDNPSLHPIKGGDAGACDSDLRPAEEHPRRSGAGVHIEGSRSVGVEQRCHARLLPARQADRQCLRGIIQRQGSSGVHRPKLVPVARRCPIKMRGLSERLQYRATAQRHRQQDPDGAVEIRRATQPSDGLKNGKFRIRPVQGRGQGHFHSILAVIVSFAFSHRFTRSMNV